MLSEQDIRRIRSLNRTAQATAIEVENLKRTVAQASQNLAIATAKHARTMAEIAEIIGDEPYLPGEL